MSQYQTDMYTLCSDLCKGALESFCRNVNNSKADVFVVMAHKAVKMFTILLDQGLLNEDISDKIIITNLALDFDCSYLKDKKIAIIDDIVISGTSIASTINKLIEMSIPEENIEVYAVAIDSDYFAMKFESKNGKNLLSCEKYYNDSVCIDISAAISKIFSYYGVPYDVDFPAYDSIPIGKSASVFFFDSIFWSVANVTNGSQKVGKVKAYTLYPSSCVQQKLWKKIGCNLEEIAHLKVRVYFKEYPNKKRQCTVIPMCLFNEVAVNDVNALYDLLKPTASCLTINSKREAIAQLRFLEFYVAHQLFTVFSEITSIGCGQLPLLQSIQLLFGHKDGERVYNLLQQENVTSITNSIVTFSTVEYTHNEQIDEYLTSEEAEKIKDIIPPTSSEIFENEYWVNRTIFSPLIWWYDTKELEVRNDIKKAVPHYSGDYKLIESKLFRLNGGFSLKELQSIFKISVPKIPNSMLVRAVSSLMDRAIDDGIVVPVLAYNKQHQYLCRVYRHGEDLPFALADECRLLLFLKEFWTKISCSNSDGDLIPPDPIAEISMEKIIVLFYQIGLKKGNIFNRFLGFGNIKILRPFLSLHGVIEGVTAPNQNIHFYSERDDNDNEYITWLTKWLRREHFIIAQEDIDEEHVPEQERKHVFTVNVKRIDEYLKKNTRSTVTNAIYQEIVNVAHIIGTWFNSVVGTEGKDKFKRDITILTSCADGYVYCSAIATENHYFSKFWSKQVTVAIDNAENSFELISELSLPDDKVDYSAIVTRALHSGREKVQWFSSAEVINVINSVGKILHGTDLTYWHSLWYRVMVDMSSANKGVTEQHQELINDAVAYLFFFSACFECLTSPLFWEKGLLPVSIDEYITEIKKIEPTPRGLDTQDLQKLRQIAAMPAEEFGEKKIAFNNLLNRLLASSKENVVNIEGFLKNNGPGYCIYYNSALIVDIQSINPKNNDNLVLSLWEELPEDVEKTALNIARFDLDKETPNYTRYGFFYKYEIDSRFDAESHGHLNEAVKAYKYLYRLLREIASRLNGKAYKIRAMLLPHLVGGKQFKHCLERTILENTTKFNQGIQELLSKYCQDAKNQLLVGLDSYMDLRIVCELTTEYDAYNEIAFKEVNWLENGLLFYDNCARWEEGNASRMAYSAVAIKRNDGAPLGLGFLFRTADKIVLITCKHIVAGQESIMLTSINYPEIKVDLSSAIMYPMSTEINTSAIDEVAVLELDFHSKIPYDFAQILSMDDLETDAENLASKPCSLLCGAKCFIRKDHLTVSGAIGQGYFQINCAQSAKIEQGDSGGLYVLADSKEKVLGMHEGRINGAKIPRMIPSSLIIKAIKKAQRKEA